MCFEGADVSAVRAKGSRAVFDLTGKTGVFGDHLHTLERPLATNSATRLQSLTVPE
jgi:hypothetical protein